MPIILKLENKIYRYILISLLISTPDLLYAVDNFVQKVVTDNEPVVQKVIANVVPVVLKDPTKPQNYLAGTDIAGNKTSRSIDDAASMYLSAIFIGLTKKIAIINGKILHEGDSIGKNKIKNIRESSVLVLVPGIGNSAQELVMQLPAAKIKGKE
jgi:hypothetical protein